MLTISLTLNLKICSKSNQKNLVNGAVDSENEKVNGAVENENEKVYGAVDSEKNLVNGAVDSENEKVNGQRKTVNDDMKLDDFMDEVENEIENGIEKKSTPYSDFFNGDPRNWDYYINRMYSENSKFKCYEKYRK